MGPASQQLMKQTYKVDHYRNIRTRGHLIHEKKLWTIFDRFFMNHDLGLYFAKFRKNCNFNNTHPKEWNRPCNGFAGPTHAGS